MGSLSKTNKILGVLALCLLLLSIFQLERARDGIARQQLSIGTIPATLYRSSDASAPTVIIAHGFAGSRQLMEAYALTLARAGYRVLAYDLQGHGRNPVPMSGDVTVIEGTTAKLVAETRHVIGHARTLPGYDGKLALLGHSMATDVIIRAALEDARIDAIVAISAFSGAITATQPQNLLMISGAWEPRLRKAALDALHLIDPDAREGDTVGTSTLTRSSIVAPNVEHIAVLHSPPALRASRDWLNQSFGRETQTSPAKTGYWILAMLFGTVLLFKPIVAVVSAQSPTLAPPRPGRLAAALIAPALLAPLIAIPLHLPVLPVLVADYLALHLAIYGLIQLALLRPSRAQLARVSPIALALLLVWGIALFGLLLDRYSASFLPSGARWIIIAVLCIGTVPAMIADAYVTRAGHAPLWLRAAARLSLFASLTIAALTDPEARGFLLIIFPVLVLFFLVHGLMGRWIAQKAGAATAGIGLGLVLAYALGVSFPLFAA